MPIMPTSLPDQVIANGFDVLTGGHDQGAYTLPDEFVEPYRALVANPKAPAAARHYQALCDATSYQGARYITEYLQPALAEHIGRYAADLAILGAFADLAEPNGDLLAADDDVRAAYLRHTTAHDWYNPIRIAWRVLRAKDYLNDVCPDPRGVDSALAEFANVPAVVPGWRSVGTVTKHGWSPVPWEQHGNAPHLRLAWALRHGMQVWVPTAAEQTAAWQRYQVVEVGGADRRMVSHTTATQ